MKVALIGVAAVIIAGVAIFVLGMRAGDKAPAVGTSAPDFTLNSQEGKPVSLSDFRGMWVVLYFYPKDFTSGCTVEAHNFQRDLTLYEKKNAVIVGVSMQDEDSHQKFCTKEGLSFKLLADTKHDVSSLYDSVMNLAVAKLSARHNWGKQNLPASELPPSKHGTVPQWQNAVPVPTSFSDTLPSLLSTTAWGRWSQ